MGRVMGLIAAGAIALALAQPARAELGQIAQDFQSASMTEAYLAGLDWKVGDKASYKMSGGIFNGTMESFVREDTGTALWMQQDINMVFGKQKMETLINKVDGRILELLVNGQKQTPPDPADMERLEMKEDHIRVSAGEFDAIYVKLRNKKDGKITEAWVNPQAVPMTGMLKTISESQFGKITLELTSFSRAP